MFIYSVILNYSMGMTSSECSTDCWFSRKSKDWVLTILQEWSPHPSVLALSSRGWLCLHLHYLMALRTRRDRSEVRSVSASAWSMKYLQPAGWPVNWVRFSQQGHSSQLKVMEWQSKSCLQRALGSGCTLHGAVCVSNSSLAWLRYQDTCRTYWQSGHWLWAGKLRHLNPALLLTLCYSWLCMSTYF